jgi:hypothetical protein
MKSPFPGMDPYLERNWQDVHGNMIFLAKTALQPQLGGRLVARSDERIIVEDPTEIPRRIGPDIPIVEFAPEPRTSARGGVAVAEPVIFNVESEPLVQRYIEIIDVAAGGKVITVIEFVSPTNKLAGDGRDQYKQKQDECRHGGVNLVEVDLTRHGRRELLAHRWAKTRDYDSTYQASIWRASNPGSCGLYPIKLQDRLPTIRVPLRAVEADASLNLQSLLDGAYEASNYGLTIDYTRDPDPPLADEDAAWANELLRAAGKRK